MSRVVLDGPMGTQLIGRGVALPGPAWSAHALDSAPDAVAAIHADYVAAGATVHTANTFRTQRRSVGARWEELARCAVRLARRAGAARIAGSIAPLEDCYRPDLSPGAGAAAEHAELARVLASEHVDLLLCETFPSPLEAAVAVEQAAKTGVETWVALTAGPDADLMTPAAMRAAAADCVGAGASAVLVNCTPAVHTLGFVQALAGLGVPFGAYANAGAESDHLGWSHDDSSAADAYAALAREWLAAGATILGGCCGTGPAHIARLAGLV
jgi:S-methylmethionine-dependent homocysteine/selenocysteine methylase